MLAAFLVAPALALACATAIAANGQPARPGFTIESRVLSETRRINVYTPPGYETGTVARHPVLYMPDGGLDEDFPHVAADVDAAIREGAMRAMIVVGIENTERRRDMTGTTTVEGDRKIAPRVGGSAKFRAFIAEELVPEVERRYRTTAERAIVGESLAGLFVLETLFEQPELFDTYIALSPSLWWNAGSLVEHAAARLAAWPADLRKAVYFAHASDDDVDGKGKALAAILREHAPGGLRWHFEAWSGLDHATIYRGASPSVFRRMFAPRQPSHGTSGAVAPDVAGLRASR